MSMLEKAQKVYGETKTALQTVYDSLNEGQKKQIVKRKEVKTLFDRYGVQYDE